MSIATKLTALTTAMVNYRNALTAAIAKKSTQALSAANSLKLGTKTLANFQADVTAARNAHQAASNPHNVTAASLLTYTTAEVDTKFGDKILQGILPMSLFKVSGNLMVRKTGAIWEVYTVGLKAMLSGRFLKRPAGTWNALTIDLVSGTTYYLYLLMNGGIITIDASINPLTENETTFYIGTFTGPAGTVSSLLGTFGTNDGGIVRIENFRINTAAKGSSIPVSTSVVGDAPSLLWT